MELLAKWELPADLVNNVRNIRHFNGIPMDVRLVTDELVAPEEGETN
jgi:hypothetical protein